MLDNTRGVTDLMPNPQLKNAPLLEVVAELQWKLPNANGAIEFDAGWFDLARQLKPVLLSVLPLEEPVIPVGVSVPLDAVGRTPLVRYRTGSGGWPLVQLGQGMLTVNATPPYDGWERVKGILAAVLGGACEVSEAFRGIELQIARLYYRNALTSRHGIKGSRQFLAEQVPFFPHAVFDHIADLAKGDERPTASGELTFALAGAEKTLAAVRYGVGTLSTAGGPEDAVVLDFTVTGDMSGQGTLDLGKTLDWFETAHSATYRLFQQVVPKQTMEQLR